MVLCIMKSGPGNFLLWVSCHSNAKITHTPVQCGATYPSLSHTLLYMHFSAFLKHKTSSQHWNKTYHFCSYPDLTESTRVLPHPHPQLSSLKSTSITTSHTRPALKPEVASPPKAEVSPFLCLGTLQMSPKFESEWDMKVNWNSDQGCMVFEPGQQRNLEGRTGWQKTNSFPPTTENLQLNTLRETMRFLFIAKNQSL